MQSNQILFIFFSLDLEEYAFPIVQASQMQLQVN